MRIRLWVRESKRRPNPPPAHTDDRLALSIGLGLWIIALVALLIVSGGLASADLWWLWCAGIGVALGIIGLVYAQLKRR